MSSEFTHFDEHGNARMVDVSAKDETIRIAVASGTIRMAPATAKKIQAGQIQKGDVLGVARLAAIMATKRTDELIPLCHSLPVQSVNIDFEFLDDETLQTQATVKTAGRTGVEMEALHAVTVALLTVYDMCKAVDRAMVMHCIRLDSKQGGKSGDWYRPSDTPSP